MAQMQSLNIRSGFLYLLILHPILCTMLSIWYVGCGSNVQVPRQKSPDCPTTISGRLELPLNFPDTRAMLIMTVRGKTTKLMGNYLSRTTEGILFKADYGWANANEEKLYKFNEVLCVLDSNCRTVYGSLPEKFQTVNCNAFLEMKSPTDEDISFKLEANRDFSFCITSGKYSDVRFSVVMPDGKQYVGTLSEKSELDILANTNTHLGIIKPNFAKSNVE